MRYLNKADVVKMVAAACDRAGGQRVWASENGLSPAYVTDVLKGRRDPADSICRALGLERRVIFVRTNNR